MRRVLFLLFALGLALPLAAPALARPAPPKKQIFILEGSEVWGQLIKPGGGWLHAKPAPIFCNLIDYRVDFNPEMVKMTEGL